ncbi:MAG TPA: tetratricopeptide repeat protein [bacterium]|nr:tetratricopeptide repeat protein [bacterium]
MDKKLCYGTSLIVFLGIALFLFGCAASGPGMREETSVSSEADIDQLLGLSDTAARDGDDSIQEDDVLRLLGVREESEAGTSRTETSTYTPPASQQRASSGARETKADPTLSRTEASGAERKAAESASGISTRKTQPEWRATSFQDRYEEARQDYLARRYREAIQKFEALLAIDTNHPLSDNCQYWIGESYYGLGNYQQAIIAFEKVFSFRRSNKDDDAQLKLGLSYLRLNDRERARIEFQKLIDNYPTSEYVSMARRYLSQIGQ